MSIVTIAWRAGTAVTSSWLGTASTSLRTASTFGSFMRTVTLPFEPANDAVAAYFDKGVLHLTIKKPLAAVETTKNVEIKLGAPPTGPTVVEATKEPLKAA